MTEAMPPPADREKRRLLESLLDEGLVMIHLDARRDGVDLPEHLRGQPSVALNLSRRFGLDVFEIGADAVLASLSFQGRVYLCRLPWPAVFLMTSHATERAYVFPASVPSEFPVLLSEGTEEVAPAPEPEPEAPPEPPRGRPQLRLIKNEDRRDED
jgi:stringent starvation protein B